MGARGSDNAKLTEPWKCFEKIAENITTSNNEVIDNFEANAIMEVYDLKGYLHRLDRDLNKMRSVAVYYHEYS